MPAKLTRQIHTSWLLAFASGGLLVGIALAFAFKTLYFIEIQWLIVALAILLICLTKHTAALVLLAILAGLTLGLWRGGNILAANASYQKFIGENVVIEGSVADDVSDKNGIVGMKLDHVVINNQKLSGQMWAGASTSLTLKRGDKVQLAGKLEPGFGKYAASISHGQLASASRDPNGDWPRKIRDKFTGGLEKTMPKAKADLGAGYLVGQHNNLPDELVQQLKLVGLIHIVIAGGYNVTILVRYVRRRLAGISKYLAALGASTVLGVILLVTGFSAPMSRTVVITALSLAAWYYGRKIHPLVLLPFSAAITALVDPTFVQGEVGWYLTFIAYGGLIILGPMIEHYFWGERATSNLRRIAIDTLAVTVVTMPLLAYAFQQYSIYSLPANLLVLPLMPLTMLLAIIAGISGMILPLAIAQIIGWPARILLSYTDKITSWLANAPGAHYSASFSLELLIASYAAIIAIIFYLWRKTDYNFLDENIVE